MYRLDAEVPAAGSFWVDQGPPPCEGPKHCVLPSLSATDASVAGGSRILEVARQARVPLAQHLLFRIRNVAQIGFDHPRARCPGASVHSAASGCVVESRGQLIGEKSALRSAYPGIAI